MIFGKRDIEISDSCKVVNYLIKNVKVDEFFENSTQLTLFHQL